MSKMCRALLALGVMAVTAMAPGCDSDPDETGPICTIEPTFSSIRSNYFERSCTFGDCHNAVDREGDMDLSDTNTNLYDELINVLADDDEAAARGKMRVVPMDVMGSFMVQKVEGTMAPDEGDWMPNGTDEIVDADCGVAMLKAWIAAGAPDN